MTAVAPTPRGVRWGRVALGGTAGVALMALMFLVLIAAAMNQPKQDAGAQAVYGVSATALSDIPHDYLVLYQKAGQAYGLDWAVIAGIGKVETDHGRYQGAGVTSGANFLGCCGGPMQFYFIPYSGRIRADSTNASTWGSMAVDGDGDGWKDVWDPADAIPSAANYLKRSGAPSDYRRAIWAYNHDAAYYLEVMSWADRYRGTLSGAAAVAVGSGLPGGVVIAPGANRPGVQPSPAFMAYAGEVAKVLGDGRPMVITTGTNHNRLTTTGNVSDHWAGNAADWGMGPNGFTYGCKGCRGERIAAAALIAAGEAPSVARAHAAAGGAYTVCHAGRRVQVIWRSFVGGDHFNHVHTGIGQC